MLERSNQGNMPEILFWVGCAGSFDAQAQKVTKAMVKILTKAKIDFAVLGTEESCTGDPAKRAGNEYVFQMQALKNIETLSTYGVSKIITTCPHCFNTLAHDYPELGGDYEVIHHTTFINQLLDQGRLSIEGGRFKGKRITYHDSCYLGRANKIYEAPRKIIKHLDAKLVEMKSCKEKGLCCGAGGAQMFKDSEKGNTEINTKRISQIETVKPDLVAVACPFCKTMLNDGTSESQNKKVKFRIIDIAELCLSDE